MVRPIEQIGHTLLNRYRIKRYRGDGCEGWVFVAETISQRQNAKMEIFGGGPPENQIIANVIIEIIPKGLTCDSRQVDDHNALQPHKHLVRCLDVGPIPEGEFAGASYIVLEGWKETLADFLARRSVMDEQEILNLARNIASALARYHSENRVYGDVQAKRFCLVDGQWKLAPVFCPKNRVADKTLKSTAENDIYCLGLILLSCFSHKFTFIGEDGSPSSCNKEEIEKALCNLPEFWRYWLGRCLSSEPSQRCTSAELALIGTEIPPCIAEVFVERQKDQYWIHWKPVDRGTVRVFRWTRGKCPTQGEIWLVADLERIAENVPLTMPTATQIRLHPGASCQVIVATIKGDAAVVGDNITLTWAADVVQLKVTLEGQAIVATWDWPEGAYVACVAVCEGTFSDSPNDPKARTERCFRTGYLAEGGRFIIPIDQHAGLIHVTVYAIYRHEQGWECACGRTTGARAVISFVPSIRLHYRIKKIPLLAQLLFNAEPCRLSIRAEQSATLPELTLVAGESNPPFEMGSGIPILQVPSLQYEQGEIVYKDFRLPKGIKAENTRLLVHNKANDKVRLIPERGRL